MSIVDMFWAAVILVAAGWLLYTTSRRDRNICEGCSGCSCTKMNENEKDGMVRLP
ncbi:MAG: FeoB-associated Cys-rich membrane protein [Deltaproteobacteria bacterium]|nr:FeoB-associated Cys-rich membrane protein [Deltaproteobacteria bacterium]